MQSRTEIVDGITVTINQGDPIVLSNSIAGLTSILQSLQNPSASIDPKSVQQNSPESVAVAKLGELYNVELNLIQTLSTCAKEYTKVFNLIGITKDNQKVAFEVMKQLDKFPSAYNKAHETMTQLAKSIDELSKLKFDKVPNDPRMNALINEILRSLDTIKTPHIRQQVNNQLVDYRSFGLKIVEVQKSLSSDRKKIYEWFNSSVELDANLMKVAHHYKAQLSQALQNKASASPNVQAAPAAPNRVAPPPPSRPAPVAPGFMHSNQPSAQKAQEAKQRGQIYPAPNNQSQKK